MRPSSALELRDWSLITGKGVGGGSLQNRRGGGYEVYPTKRGDRKGFSHAEGGGGAQQVLGSFLRSSLKF